MKKFFIKSLRLLQHEANGIRLSVLMIPLLMVYACETQEGSPGVDDNAVFLSFSSQVQTLPTSINDRDHAVKMEVSHGAEVTKLFPEFDVPAGYSVYADGIEQISGISEVDFSNPVTYELHHANHSTAWQVWVVPLGCKILIDASHDGGVWWFPQYEGTGFDPNQWHQGQQFADLLRAKGFEVTELGRGIELAEEMFFGHYIVSALVAFKPIQSKNARSIQNC